MKKDILSVISYLWHHIVSRGERPTAEIIKIFKENNWTYTGKIYRGLHWSYGNLYELPTGQKFKIGDKVTEPYNFSSWTTDKLVAISFAASGDYDNNILNPNISFSESMAAARDWGTWSKVSGIVVEAYAKNDISIQKAYDELKKRKDLFKYFKKFAKVIFSTQRPESEVLMLAPVQAKILIHFHQDLSSNL